MSELILTLDEGQVTLSPDISYQVYGETMYAIDVIELDLQHLCWLDQKTLLQDIILTEEVSILYHPDVVTSLYSEMEASPYWGKNRYDCLATFKRLQTKVITDDKEERKLMKPVDWKNKTTQSKRGKIVSRMVLLGYDRVYSRDIFKKFLADKGDGYMNLTVNTVANLVDEYVRDIKTETEGRYIRADSQKSCTIYLVRFTNKSTGETFIKPGITSRDLGERFISDKKLYDIEVIHTATHPMADCVDREKAIQERYKDYRYVPEHKLNNNGTTEIMSVDCPINEIITLMGTSKVK